MFLVEIIPMRLKGKTMVKRSIIDYYSISLNGTFLFESILMNKHLITGAADKNMYVMSN